MSRFDLPTESLATLDESGGRIHLAPAPVDGRWVRRRRLLQPLLIVIFLVVPWIRIRGNPALLIGITSGHFSVLGVSFGSHDVPILFLVVISFVFTVALVTALWGRVWCGWLCPQTVFIEAVFRRIERWTEGYTPGYRQKRQAPTTWEGWGRRFAKWTGFVLVSLLLAHVFVSYFVGTDRLLAMVRQSPAEAPGWFLFMTIVTVVVLVDFGWLREQFCVIACPYGKIQSVFTDRHSKVVAYDATRPDCVNCYRCVQVCPTGIDIRRGSGQLECIGCTACIDACDEVMRKIGKPEGLIRHGSPVAGPLWRPRTLSCAFILLVALTSAVFAVRRHREFDLSILRAIGAPYEQVGDVVIAHFHAEVWNSGLRPFTVKLAPLSSDFEVVAPSIQVQPGEKKRTDFFVKSPRGLTERGPKRVRVRWTVGEAVGDEEIELVGPTH